MFGNGERYFKERRKIPVTRLFATILLGIILLSLVGMALVSCKTYVPIEKTIVRKDSVITREKLVPITIQGSAVATHIGRAQYDSLVTALKHMPANNRTIYLTDPTMATRLQIMLDSTGKALAFKCETLEREHLATLTERDYYKKEYEKIVLEKVPSFWEKIESFFRAGGTWLILVIIGLVVWVVLKKARP